MTVSAVALQHHVTSLFAVERWALPLFLVFGLQQRSSVAGMPRFDGLPEKRESRS